MTPAAGSPTAGGAPGVAGAVGGVAGPEEGAGILDWLYTRETSSEAA